MKKIKLFTLIAAVVCAANGWAWSGSGTSGDPYLIASASDWNTLATNVNGGTSYSGMYFQLTTDINVSEMVGTDTNRFSGIFIGDGHTLTFNQGTSGSRTNDAPCAPFLYISGASIKRLHVTGTIYTSNQFAAMVGRANGTNNIQSCHSSLIINSTKDGDGTHGGFIGVAEASGTTISNCLFDGQLIGSSTNNCGGFVGWSSNGITLKNCLFAPASVTVSTSGSKTFSRGNNVNVTNCYYKQTFGDAQGTNAGSMNNNDLKAALGDAWQVSGGKVVPIMQLKALTGGGTAGSPYLIASTTDWNNFAYNVNLGESYSGCYFKLTADITVSEMVGTDANRFSGIFIGDGHTLTFNKGTSGSRFSEIYCGPFRFINGATIKRLRVAGTIYTSNQHAAVIGNANGTNNIQLCRSSLVINSSKSGDGTHAGFIGVLDGGSTYFTNCLFDGTFEGASTESWGGLNGWARGHAYFTNCLFAPTSVNINTSGSATFSRNSINAHCTNCYYKQSIGDVQGTDGSSMTKEQLVAALGSGWEISGEKVIPSTQMQALTGNGTAESPYLIASTTDWGKLAFNVAECNEPYSCKYFRLTADIAITSTVGTEACAFGGIFDGDGHVLHLNIKDVSNDGTAPFRYIQNATIQYVKTDGFLTGKTHCAGLVGFANGTNLIQGCEVAAEVYGGDGCTHNGGILGHGKNSTTTIQDCLFSGALEGATNTAGIIYGWGDGEGHHTIINCLFSGECGGSPTTVLIAERGTKTITNCYRSSAGPTDGTDASSMSRAALLSALGAGWGKRETHVVPVRFAAAVTPQEGAATIDLESDYVPTQIKNGTFGVRPWMSYRYNSTDYTSYYAASSVGNDKIIEASYPNGVNGGWNTTENKTLDRGLYEYAHSIYNDYVSTYGGCVEMNSQNCAVLWQDLTTHSHDVIRWSLLHAVRTNYGPDVQSMRVEVGAPESSGGNIVAATGLNEAVDSKIITDTKATYSPSGYSGTYAKGGDNLAKLALNKNTAPDNNAWHQVRGIYLIPEGQTVTRFAFISTSIDADANKMSAGNYLDNLAFSTLIGNLSAEQLPTGDVVLKGYWGETDANKHLVVVIGSTSNNYDMTSVANENFKLTIPAATIGAATSLSVYHEDYSDANRTIEIAHSIAMESGTPEADKWILSTNFALVGTAITLDYSGDGKIQSVILRNVQNPSQTASTTEASVNSRWTFNMPVFNTEVVVEYVSAEASIDAPTAIENLTCTGSAQTLINAGSATNGTIQYSLDGTNWDYNNDNLPSATAAGYYTVYYHAIGDAKHLDNPGSYITVSISNSVTTNQDPQHHTDYYSTFYDSQVKYEVPEGVEAYVADLSGDELLLTKIAVGGQVLPSDVAVILKAHVSGNINLPPSNAAAVTFTANNDLRGVDEETAVTSIEGLTRANCYVLSGQEGVGFYKINSDNLKAHKAYVKYDGSSSGAPRRMRFVFNNEQVATNMETISSQQSAISSQKVLRDGQLIIIRNGVRYNAQGQIVK